MAARADRAVPEPPARSLGAHRPRPLLIAYIDESYDQEACAGYWMAGVVVHERALSGYWADLLDAASAVSPVCRGTELHGADLFNGTGDFAGLTPNHRIEIFRRGLKAVARHQARIATAAHIPNATEIPEVRAWRLAVLTALVPMIEEIAVAAGQRVVLVCDEERTTTARVLELLHRRRTALDIDSTPILETAMFARSVHSPGVWPADLIAYVERRLALGYADDRGRRHTLRRLRDLYASCHTASVTLSGPVPPH